MWLVEVAHVQVVIIFSDPFCIVCNVVRRVVARLEAHVGYSYFLTVID